MDRWKTCLASAALSGAIALGAVALTSQESDAIPATVARVPSAVAAVTPAVVEEAEPATEALDAISTDARFAVSVLDVATGEGLELSHDPGGDEDVDTASFDTASIVKVDILAALLLQHQEAGTELTTSERALATVMIEQSDNDAATSLFRAVGGEDGLEDFNRTIGLTGTDVGANGNWGLTQTTAQDQVRLLQVVFGDESVLSEESQAFEQALMADVVDAQTFGVSAAADDPADAALKIGYLQRSATGLWDVTSIGRIEVDGRTLLVAVLSDGSSSLAAGTALVDDVARAAVDDLTAI